MVLTTLLYLLDVLKVGETYASSPRGEPRAVAEIAWRVVQLRSCGVSENGEFTPNVRQTMGKMKLVTLW